MYTELGLAISILRASLVRSMKESKHTCSIPPFMMQCDHTQFVNNVKKTAIIKIKLGRSVLKSEVLDNQGSIIVVYV